VQPSFLVRAALAASMAIVFLAACGGNDSAAPQAGSADTLSTVAKIEVFDSAGLTAQATDNAGHTTAVSAAPGEQDKVAHLEMQYPSGEPVKLRLRSADQAFDAVVKEGKVLIGDIIVGERRGEELVTKGGIWALGAEPGADDDKKRPLGSGIVNSPGQKWPGGVIPYVFDANAPQSTRDAFLGAARDYAAKTAIRLVPRTNERDYVRVISGSGCYSYVGRIGGAQDLSLAQAGCADVNVARHEIGHAVGLAHEQVRQDRDRWITLNVGGSQNEIDRGSAGTPIGPYDFQSMMHYRSYFRNGRWDYVPKTDFPPEQVGNDRVNTFTPGDLGAIAAIYGPPGSDVPADAGAVFFEHVGYAGASFWSRPAGVPLVSGEWNDRISSIRVQPGLRLELFEHANYGGRSIVITGSVDNIVARGFNDIVSSYRLVKIETEQQTTTFYRDVDYQGGGFTSTPGTLNALSGEWNDRISSIRVQTGHELVLYADSNRGGRSITVRGDVPSLVALGFNDVVSSYVIRRF
jgi:hypothetical protein